MLSPHRAGLLSGTYFSLLHIVWAILVFAGVSQAWLDIVLPLHFLNNPFITTPFDIYKAGMLIITTFVGGYVLGFIFIVLARLFQLKND